MIALLSRFQNDAHVRVIDVESHFTMDQVAVACAAPAVDRQVRHPALTVEQAGFRHYECVDVFVE
jgi:hypothetical protein